MRIRRRDFLKATGGGAAGAVLRGRAWAQAKPIRIGYTLSATGPYSVGAGITQGTGYALWLEQVNAKGGLAVKGEGRRSVEYVTIDDRSEIETAVRQVFDLRPASIIRDLDLLRPIYRETAAYGHFGRELEAFTWERADRAALLRESCGLEEPAPV